MNRIEELVGASNTQDRSKLGASAFKNIELIFTKPSAAWAFPDRLSFFCKNLRN